MTEVATPRTEATPAVTPAGAVEHRTQGRPVQGGGRCQGREGHETKFVGTGISVEGNPANLVAIKENNDFPCSTSMVNRTNTTAAAGARRPPPRAKTGKPAGIGHPAPTTYVAKPKKIVTSGSWPASTRTVENRSQDRAVQKEDKRRDREGTGKKHSRTVSSKNYGSNNLPSDTGMNNYVNPNTAVTGADKVRPRPQTDGPAGTGRLASPAVGPPRG